MTIEIKSVSGRKPFVFGPGCSSPSIPNISVIPCSLPSLTRASSANRPIMFNIPQVQPPVMMAECIRIKPILSVTYKKPTRAKPAVKTGFGSFRTQSGFSNCLEGRYRLGYKLNMPCLDLVFSSPGDSLVKITPVAGQSSSGCTYKFAVNDGLTGFDGDITSLNGVTVSSNGVYMRYVVAHYYKGMMRGLSGFNRRATPAEIEAFGKKAPSGSMEARAPQYRRPGEFFKIIGFTRCQ